MNLDSRTVIYLIAFSACTVSIGLFALTRSFPGYVKGITRWMYATFAQTLGWLLVGMRGSILDRISTVIGSTLVVLAFALYYHALNEFKDQSFRKFIPYSIVGVVLISSAYFSIPTDNAAARIVVLSAGAAFLMFLSGHILVVRGDDPRPFSHWFTGIGFLACSVVLAARALNTAFFTNELPYVQDVLQDLFFLSFFFTVTAITFGFMLMCHDRYVVEIERLVMLDSLTEAHNRRAIRYLMKKEISRSVRADLPLSVLMIDVDRFKAINDTHGHDGGDAVLKHVALTITDQLREQDLIGRYGGDEFLAVLPDTTAVNAQKVAERIRSSIEQAEFGVDGRSITLTLSIGVAELDHNAPDEQMLIRRADWAMYESKNRGNNRVQLASN